MHGQIQDLLVFHQFYSSTLLSFIVIILFPVFCSILQYFTWVPCFITTEFVAHESSKHKAVRNFWGWCITYTSDTDSLSFWPILPLTVDWCSADNQWSTYWRSVGHYIKWDICWQSVDMWTITLPISQLIYRSICRPTYLGRYIGRVSVNMSTDISVECWSICRVSVSMLTDISVEGCIKYTWSENCRYPFYQFLLIL